MVDEIFCIAREALKNAFRHAEASQIAVDLDYQKREFRMTCRDNGCGFDPAALYASHRHGHWGLHGMAEGVKNIDAMLSWYQCPGKRYGNPCHRASAPSLCAIGSLAKVLRPLVTLPRLSQLLRDLGIDQLWPYSDLRRRIQYP